MTWRKSVIEVALGKKPADVATTGGKLVNVNTGEVYSADVAIVGERIAIVGDVNRGIGPNTEVVDAEGCYLVPGLIDSHVHPESSGVTLTQMSRLLLPRGVTTIMYAHEIANVLGVPGMQLVREESRQVPLKVYFQTPTSVPWLEGLETPAVTLTVDDVREMLAWKESVSLGEADYLDVVHLTDALLAKMDAAHALGKPVDGHVPQASGEELMAVVAAGVNDDHSTRSSDTVLTKLRLGMKVILNESYLPRLTAAITEHDIDTRNLLLCIDDKLANTILREGGVDNTVRVAIAHGIEPMTAIQMATINAATHFRLDLDIGSISPGRIGDVIVTDSLEELIPRAVIANGQLVARDGEFLLDIPQYHYPDWAKDTVHLKRAIVPGDFEITAGIEEGEVEARVLKVWRGAQAWDIKRFPVRGGRVVVDVAGPYNLIAVVERHGGDGNIALGIVDGIGLEHGAVASSVSHDCHNITVVGTNAKDMAACVNALAEVGGGFAAVERGEVVALVELEIAGLISEASYEDVVRKLDHFETTIQSRLGFPTRSFLGFSFIPFEGSPRQASITDRGLIDTCSLSIVPLIVSASTL